MGKMQKWNRKYEKWENGKNGNARNRTIRHVWVAKMKGNYRGNGKMAKNGKDGKMESEVRKKGKWEKWNSRDG